MSRSTPANSPAAARTDNTPTRMLITCPLADLHARNRYPVNQQWFRVIGVAGSQLTAQADVAGLPAQDRNNLIYVPIRSALLRLEDSLSWQKDEIDAVYVSLATNANVVGIGAVMRGLLETSHRGASDFTVIVPAELLAEQQRTKQLFAVVMVAIASISLLVGGIGIMNIMLASVMERTREIGLRRAVGATRRAIVRQFLVETTTITVTGGFLGTLVGIVLSQLVAYFAGWSTIVSVAGRDRVRGLGVDWNRLRAVLSHPGRGARSGTRPALRVNACARVFAKDRHDLVLVARNESKLRDLAAEASVTLMRDTLRRPPEIPEYPSAWRCSRHTLRLESALRRPSLPER